MKQLILIHVFIFSGFNCIAQKTSDCNYLKLSIEYLMQNKKVINQIHSDLKTRIPFNFKTSLTCELKSSLFNIINSNDATKKNVVDITDFKITGNKIKINLYYKEEGAGINSILKINEKNLLEIIDLEIYEN